MYQKEGEAKSSQPEWFYRNRSHQISAQPEWLQGKNLISDSDPQEIGAEEFKLYNVRMRASPG